MGLTKETHAGVAESKPIGMALVTDVMCRYSGPKAVITLQLGFKLSGCAKCACKGYILLRMSGQTGDFLEKHTVPTCCQHGGRHIGTCCKEVDITWRWNSPCSQME